MITKQTAVDKIEIVGKFKAVQVREATVILEDGVQFGNPEYHRYVVAAGQDYSELPQEVQEVCALVHTPEIIAAYEAHLTSQGTL